MKLGVRDMTRTALFASLICIASFLLKLGGEVAVPFSILPFMVLLSGSVLGSRLGALSVILYVLIGLVGVPVFAQSPFGGLTYVLHPTFGFVLGYILAAYMVGLTLRKIPSMSIWKYWGAMLVGIVALYLLGIPYFYGIIKFYLGQPLTMWKTVKIAFLPFIGLDVVKGILAGVIAKHVVERLEP